MDFGGCSLHRGLLVGDFAKPGIIFQEVAMERAGGNGEGWAGDLPKERLGYNLLRGLEGEDTANAI